ncbi:NlpC/P60 family protein [Corynebacterium sp. YIM 101645]|uniref:NlpC/P60 family protein n=1 Tax=Corynebacterium lemuris TaxID=1859292 RepID=A0ABT2FX69_9CORY|nr:NlpC/P60 family protein [Corynebacterium lemuris]MCS5479390.1 NlpC/P60 family protein [Corynebacterium lemuris]
MTTVVLGAFLITTGTAPVAAAEDIDTLIATMDEASHEATATSEEVKQLEVDIGQGQGRIDTLRADADAARQRAEVARAARADFQEEVDGLAGVKYRGLLIDPVTNAIAAATPQNAIDRASYLATLTRNTERAVDKLAETTAEAGRAHTDAERFLAEANFQQSQLERQHRDLAAEQEVLQERIREIEEQVTGLDAASRAAWENKNNPLTPDLAGASGVVAAALAKLGSPYGWGATGPNQFDCSGLMFWAYQQQGKTIPRTSQAQLAGGTPVPRAELQPGDIVGYYPGITHVGMYIGNGQLVHASDYGIPVQVVSVDSMPWAGAVRY